MRRKRSFREWITTGKVNKRLVMVTFMFVPLLLLIVLMNEGADQKLLLALCYLLL